MTTQEFNLEFDIYYNNIASNNAPEINAYEKSVFLTDAQEQIVRELYDKGGYENSELSRRHLDNLKRQSVRTSPTQNAALAASTNSWFFTIPNDLMYIVKENVRLVTPCTDIIDVLPVTEDEYNLQKSNPFRKPSVKGRNKFAWRLDHSKISTNRSIEIVLAEDATLNQYIVRYIKKPNPIVLVDLDTIDESLSIEGVTEQTECELDSIVHRYILKLAVENAYKIYMGIKQNQ